MTRREALPNFYAVLDAARWTGRRLRPLLPGMAFLLLLGYVILNVTAGDALEQELSAIRSQGAPLSLREAAPPLVPDPENAARVYQQAFDRLPHPEMPRPATRPGQPRAAGVDERVIESFLSGDPRRQQSVTIAQVRQALAGTEAALALVRRASAMPRCRFPVNWDAGPGALFPHYPKLLSLSRLLGAHAILAAQAGAPGSAAADIQAIVGLARHILSEHVMIGEVVAYRCLSIARSSLQRSMEAAPLTPAQRRSLEDAWAAVELPNNYERTIETERCLGLWVFDFARQHPDQLPALIGNEEKVLVLPYRLGPLGEPLRKLDEVWYLRAMAREIGRARRAETGQSIDRSSDPPYPWYAAVSRLMLPAFDAITRKWDNAKAGRALVTWALALEEYRQQTGRYPDSLEEVKQRLGGTLPDDPFTAGEPIYRRQGSGYRLYSVGENRRDDHGGNWNDKTPPGNGAVSPGQDDIAWWFQPTGCRPPPSPARAAPAHSSL